MTGSITGYVDVAQLVLYAFWVFFAGLILYLRREDKREGYPLESDRSQHVRVEGFPSIPPAKLYALPHGGGVDIPSPAPAAAEPNAEPTANWPGAPLEPLGDPMLSGVGPAAYADRAEAPDLTHTGAPRIVPMRVARDFFVEPRDPDPRGMPVVGADGAVGGTVCDIWVDRAEPQIRYLELEVASSAGARRALLPISMARVDGRRGRVTVASILGEQFARVPALRSPDQITLREEDRICAYFASGHLFAVPSRREAVL
jgi:photosynthetic reaction center H subunit